MNCCTQVRYCLEFIGLYNPNLSWEEANQRLLETSNEWKTYQKNRTDLWDLFQSGVQIDRGFHPLTQLALSHFTDLPPNKIALNLGCGMSADTIALLRQGWKVYAVDSSPQVLQTLKNKIAQLGETWLQDGKLILWNATIEDVQIPQQVHFVIATEAFAYCDPAKMQMVLLKIQQFLVPGQGMLACNFFPDHFFTTAALLVNFGGWTTTKNVVEALMKKANFARYEVSDQLSVGGKAWQFHVVASNF